MEVREGFKQTEIGIIPEDWEIKPCSSVSSLITVGIVIKPTQYYSKQGVPALRSANIREDRIDPQNMVFISEKANSVLTKSQVQTGDVLTVRTGYPGTSAVVPPEFDGANCIDILITRPSKVMDSRFLSTWVNSEHGKNQVFKNQGGLAQKHFNVEDMRNLLVALPPTKAEQEAIAEALSDADGLIESLEQLIDKKRQIKQGAMQEFFIPETDDRECLLKEVSTLKGRIGWQGLKQSEFTDNANKPFLITGMNFKDGAIRWGEVYHISDARYKMAPEIQLRKHDLLMTKDGTIGKVLYVDEIPYPGTASLNSHLLLFRPKQNSYCPRYLYYQLQTKRFKDFIELNKSGTTFFGISQGAVGNYKTLLPLIEKQEVIASTLTDMDAEITELETKLTKARKVKQGMMQELFTGRIRLV
nr:restriction endonuclease subunit S [Pseudodesulfovibrio sp.]